MLDLIYILRAISQIPVQRYNKTDGYLYRMVSISPKRKKSLFENFVPTKTSLSSCTSVIKVLRVLFLTPLF